MAYPGPPRRAAGMARYLIAAVVILSTLYYFRGKAPIALSYPYSHHPAYSPTPITTASATKVAYVPPDPIKSIANTLAASPSRKPTSSLDTYLTKETENPSTSLPRTPHPIDNLIEDAEKTFQNLLEKESHSLSVAAAGYRARRGRHPPPGFDKWFTFAKDNRAVLVEDFFDQIYHDLGPYWGLPAATIRKESWDYEMTINVRNHTASSGSDWFWTQIWLNMTKTIEHLLPDMDIPLNPMDEPRVLAPWEEVNKFMEIERRSRHLTPTSEIVQDFHALPSPGQGDRDTKTRPKNWEDKSECHAQVIVAMLKLLEPFWNLAIRGCHPDSLARKSARMTDFSHTPSMSLANTKAHTTHGFVSNSSLSGEFCHQPDLQGLHGVMIEPLSVSSTKTFTPMFGGSKLATNNEILLPAPMYWNGEERFSGGEDHGEIWKNKQDKVIWRGVATGGKNTASNWKGFQRHRFVAMTNATQVSGAESWKLIPENFALPPSQYDLAAQEEGHLGPWMNSWSDTGFVDLMCDHKEEKGTCNYTSPYYRVVEGIKMAGQFACKYLPDIDGNSFSGRYRGFLLSTSLPIKATIFKEWHDSRLIAWKHFVPMDNRFMVFWGIMQYFLGYEGERKVKGHDEEAERIAVAGQEWANRVLRKEDMQIYTLRLLLEYARVSDDMRDRMGWVDDLL